MAKFTQQLQMHLNGGSKFSASVYAIYKDGKPTGITRTIRTNGRPHYQTESDVFTAPCGEKYDCLANGRLLLSDWLNKQTQTEAQGGNHV